MGYKGHEYIVKNYSRQRLISDMKNLYLSFFEKKKIQPASTAVTAKAV